MTLQKTILHYILFISIILVSCNSNIEQSTNKNTIPSTPQETTPPFISQTNKKEVKKDTIFYNNIRPNQPLYLNKFYQDTFEVVGENNDSDYFFFIFRKDDSLFNLLYYVDPDKEGYALAQGDMVEVTWKIDTIYIAGEDDLVTYDLWLVEPKKLSSKPLEVNDTLSILKNVLEEEFLDYSIMDWATGDINKNEKEDFVVVLESNFTDPEITGDEETKTRKTVILETTNFPNLKISTSNDAIVDCSMCSGSGNRDPHEDVVIKNDQIIFYSTYGGSPSDHFEIIFKYFVEKENWFLREINKSNYNSQEDKSYTKTRTQKDFGEILFEDYKDIKDEN